MRNQTRLRRERIEVLLQQRLQKIEGVMNLITEQDLLNIDIEQRVKKIQEQYSLHTPVLEKEKISVVIKEETIRGENLPVGFTFVPGMLYSIEVAEYKVPFRGDHQLFTYQPTIFTSRVGNIELHGSFFIIRTTNYDRLTNNEQSLEVVKNRFQEEILNIESFLNNLGLDLERFNKSIDAKVRSTLMERIRIAKSREIATNKLNPFT